MASALRPTRRRFALAAAALLAVAFLGAMALSGRTRTMQNLVAFEAAGLMRETPDRIDRVEIAAEARRSTFVRAAGAWRTGGADSELGAAVASHLETSLKFMHVTAPIRTLARGEYDATLGEYGLDPPRYTVALWAGSQPVLTAGFGAANPQGLFQYVRVGGRDALYLLPVFVGREWERVLAAMAPPRDGRAGAGQLAAPGGAGRADARQTGAEHSGRADARPR